MEPNQVHVVTAAVSRDLQQIIYALEPRLTGQIVRDICEGNRRNRIYLAARTASSVRGSRTPL